MTVTVENTGSETPSPFDWYDTETINGAEAHQIFDSANGVGGAPYADILPGRSATYVMAVAVPATGGELIVQTRFFYRDSIYHIGRVLRGAVTWWALGPSAGRDAPQCARSEPPPQPSASNLSR
jgi:hypothetical protein